MRLESLEITLDLIAACACPACAGVSFDSESRLLAVHPHHVGGTRDLAAVDVNSGALVDVVADLHVGAADDDFAGAGPHRSSGCPHSFRCASRPACPGRRRWASIARFDPSCG